MWPTDKSLSGLRRRLERTSDKNRQLILAILDAGDHGIYANELAKRVHFSRDEVIYRTKELASQELVEIVSLTDMNYRINDGVYQAVGPNGVCLLRAIIQLVMYCKNNRLTGWQRPVP